MEDEADRAVAKLLAEVERLRPAAAAAADAAFILETILKAGQYVIETEGTRWVRWDALMPDVIEDWVGRHGTGGSGVAEPSSEVGWLRLELARLRGELNDMGSAHLASLSVATSTSGFVPTIRRLVNETQAAMETNPDQAREYLRLACYVADLLDKAAAWAQEQRKGPAE